MKRRSIAFCICAILLGVLTACFCLSCGDVHQDVKHVSSEMKLKHDYTSLEEIENDARLIVIGRKADQVETVYLQDDTPCMTISSFIVDTVLKDETNSVSVGASIDVMEYESYDEKNGIVYHCKDYEMMKEGERYILFLELGEYYGKTAFDPLGVNLGVTSFEDDYLMIEHDWSGEHQEYRAKVNFLREEIRAKYK